jgi:O-antigen ligase
MLAFMTVLFISIVTTGQKPHWVLLLNGYVYPFLFFYFARAVMNTERQIKIVFAYLVFIGLYCGVMGVFEKLQWYELVFPKFIVDPTVRAEGLTRLGFRVRGIFLMPAVLGAVMVMGFFPAWLFLQRMKGILARVAQLVLVLATPATIFFTNTRSTYLGFVVALVMGAILSRKLRTLCLAIILASMVGVFLNWDNIATEDRDRGGLGEMDTIAYRLNLLYEATEIFLDYPLFGCGFKNFTEMAKDYRKPRDVPFFGHIDVGLNAESVSHNAFITIAVEQGVLGFVPFLLIFIFILQESRRAYAILPREGLVSREFVICVWMAFGTYLSNAMFIEVRQFEYMNVLLFFLMGILVGVTERARGGARELSAEETVAPPHWLSRSAALG